MGCTADEKAVNLQKYICRWMTAWVVTICPLNAWAEGFVYMPSWQSAWQGESANEVCKLGLTLADYGRASFVAAPAAAVAFELQAQKDWYAPGPITATAYAPAWHPEAPRREVLGELSHIEGGGAVARDRLAANMLLALRQGLHIELASPAWFEQRQDVVVHLTAKDLRPALDKFLKCAHTNIKVSWQEMSRTRVSYDVNEYSLSEAEKLKLQALAGYVFQDPSITTLYVDGHTDASGDKRGNVRLSKHRAEAVAAYLRTLGLTEQQIVVRYHGAAYPVADNGNAAGKAQNRRTTVRLERVEPRSLAQK